MRHNLDLPIEINECKKEKLITNFRHVGIITIETYQAIQKITLEGNRLNISNHAHYAERGKGSLGF